MQHHAADHLHVVMPHAEEPPPRLAADGERLGQNVVERFAVGESLAKLDRLLSQSLVGHRLIFRLQGVDRIHPGLKFPDRAGVRRAEQRRDRPLEAAGNRAEKAADPVPNLFEHFHDVDRCFQSSSPGRRSPIDQLPGTGLKSPKLLAHQSL